MLYAGVQEITLNIYEKFSAAAFNTLVNVRLMRLASVHEFFSIRMRARELV